MRRVGLASMLHQQSLENGESKAIVELTGTGDETRALSFLELWQRSCQMAEFLSANSAIGERVIIGLPPGADFLVSVFGCALAQLVFVPFSPPKTPTALASLFELGSQCNATAAVVPEDTPADNFDGAALRLVRVSASLAFHGRERLPEDSSQKPSGLFFTSGSVSDPKGVIITDGCFEAALEFLQRRLRNHAQRCLCNVPINHLGGFTHFALLPLYTGGTSFIYDPSFALGSPADLLRVISQHRISMGLFMSVVMEHCLKYANCEELLDLDLSCLEVAMISGERMRAGQLADFVARFERIGFSDCSFWAAYGMTESTVVATSTTPGERVPKIRLDSRRMEEGIVQHTSNGGTEDTTTTLLSVGTPHTGLEVAIVDDVRERIGDEQIGEIWTRGPNVSPGYWHQDDATSEVFGQVTQNGRSGWYATGDVGLFSGGNLYIVGRTKEMVRIQCRNLFPVDIEQACRSALGVYPTIATVTAATGVFIGDQERLAIAVGSEPLSTGDRAGLAKTLRLAVSNHFQVPLYSVIFVSPEDIPKTEAGKISRSRLGKLFVAGKFSVTERTEDQHQGTGLVDTSKISPEFESWERDAKLKKICAWSVSQLCGLTGLNEQEYDANRPLADFGLDSVKALEFSGMLSKAFSIPVPPTVAWEFPTVAKMADALIDENDSDVHKAEKPLSDDIDGLSDEEVHRRLALLLHNH